VGAEIYLDFPSAGATQHLLCAAVLAKGCTTIQNAAVEPEVTSLCEFLIAMGARIEGVGTGTISITGVKALQPCEFTVPADRLQAGTYLLAGAITGGDVTACGILPEHQTPLVNKLREMGCEVDEAHDSIRVYGNKPLSGVRVRTMPYPGFPTDMQQPMAAVMTLAQGLSVVEETIYESRTGHVPELARMGAKIRTEGSRTVTIEGVRRLKGASVEASDLRAGAALVLAGLAAEGETIIRNVHFIDRGYQDIEGSLEALGARVERQSLELDKSMELS
jgi:UDP-N-acetylglucosamine 1-carboxyvinyltransferase